MSKNNIKQVMQFAGIGYAGAYRRYNLFLDGKLSISGLFRPSQSGSSNLRDILIKKMVKDVGVNSVTAFFRYRAYVRGLVSLSDIFLPIGEYSAVGFARTDLADKRRDGVVCSDVKSRAELSVLVKNKPLWPVPRKCQKGGGWVKDA